MMNIKEKINVYEETIKNHKKCITDKILNTNAILQDGIITTDGIIYGNDLDLTLELTDNVNDLNYYIVPFGKDFNSEYMTLWSDVEVVDFSDTILKILPILFNELSGSFDEIDYSEFKEEHFLGDLIFHKNKLDTNDGYYTLQIHMYKDEFIVSMQEYHMVNSCYDLKNQKDVSLSDIGRVVCIWNDFIS